MSITTLIQTFDDLYIDSSQPDTNFNSSPVMWVGKNTNDMLQRALMKFDLSFIPAGSTIISSNLDLYMDYEDGDDVLTATIVPYAVADSWDVSTVTWNNQPPINAEIAGVASDVTVPGYYSWTITKLVNKWVNGGLTNNGLELKAEEMDINESKSFVSSNETTTDKQAFKPVLVVQYKPGTQLPVSVNAVIAGRGTDTAYETVTTTDEYQSTEIRDTSDRTLVSFFVSNLTSNIADVGIEVSSDGVNFLRENYSSVAQGVQIFIPNYYATYTRIFYKSNVQGDPATLSIHYVAQA